MLGLLLPCTADHSEQPVLRSSMTFNKTSEIGNSDWKKQQD